MIIYNDHKSIKNNFKWEMIALNHELIRDKR